MGKLPAFLFYPKDWREDPVLSVCSRTARSVWLDMLCLMFFAPIRGVCQSGDGIPWSDQQVAAAIGGDIGTNVACIQELVSQGVASRNECGAIFSRRMVRDEQERRLAKERMRKLRAESAARMFAKCSVDVTPDVTAMFGACSGNGTANGTTVLESSNISNIEKPGPRKKRTDREAKSADPRFQPFVAVVDRYWKSRNTVPLVWDATEGRQLNELLSADPRLTVEQFTECLRNRAKSAGIAHSERPRKWLSDVHKYANFPLDRYGRTQEERAVETVAEVTPKFQPCGKNGCLNGWVTTSDNPWAPVKRCECWESYRAQHKQKTAVA